MKLLHATALTLIGWYLMMPPGSDETFWGCGDGIGAMLHSALVGEKKHKRASV
jgi:hypothetical protein